MGDLLGALRRHRLGLFVLAVGVLLAWLLWTARGALPAFFIAVALAFVLDPVVTVPAAARRPALGGRAGRLRHGGRPGVGLRRARHPAPGAAEPRVRGPPAGARRLAHQPPARLPGLVPVAAAAAGAPQHARRARSPTPTRPSSTRCARSWARPSRPCCAPPAFLLGLIVDPGLALLRAQGPRGPARRHARERSPRPGARTPTTCSACWPSPAGAGFAAQLLLGAAIFVATAHRPRRPHPGRLQRVRSLHPGAGGDRRRARVVPDHRSRSSPPSRRS